MSQAPVPAAGYAIALVTTTGKSSVFVEPDEVSFTIEIHTEANDLAAAKAENATLTAQALEYLSEQGVEKRDVQTRYLNVGVQYQDYRNRQDPRYVADQSISVKLRDVSSFEAINMGLLELGISGVNGPNFGSSKLETLRDEARIAAVIDARVKAVALAGALDQKIGAAFQIDDAAGRPSPVMYAQARMAENDSAGPSIATGQLEIQYEVTVSFFLR